VYPRKPPQAYARSLELGCNGNPDALARAHKAFKRRKRMPALFSAMGALAGLQQAAQAKLSLGGLDRAG
jgi:hypothetical protein